MSEFKDFLDQIKVRLTNPLLFSFLISWVVIHWQIFVGAFYLSQNDLVALGHSNFLDFVKANIDWCNGFWWPLLSAGIYSALSPLLRIVVQWFNTWINKLGNEQIRKVAKEGFIQYEMYDLLLEEVKGQRNRYEEIVKQYNELNHVNDQLKNNTIKLQEQLQRLDVEKQNLNKSLNTIFDVSLLNGKWERKIITSNNSVFKKDMIRIKEYQINVKQSDDTYFNTSHIEHFYIDRNNGINFLEVNNPFNGERQINKYSNLISFGSNSFHGDYQNGYRIELNKIPD